MKIAIAGGYGVGLTMRVPRVPKAGETVTGGVLSIDDGGKGSNQAIGVARLGASASLLTAIGADGYGARARDLWQREGVDATAVVEVPAATMMGFILVDKSGENRIAIAPGALDLLSAEAVERFRPAIAAADLLVVSLEIPVAAAVAALRIAVEEGTPTLLNPAPAAELPREAWATIGVLTPNRGEAALLTGASAEDGPDVLCDRLRERFSGGIALTLGSDGVLVDADGRRERIPALPVERVVDTTGAGDAFTAALAVGLLEGLPLAEAAALAARAGAHAVTHEGVLPGMPRRGDLGLRPSERTPRHEHA